MILIRQEVFHFMALCLHVVIGLLGMATLLYFTDAYILLPTVISVIFLLFGIFFMIDIYFERKFGTGPKLLTIIRIVLVMLLVPVMTFNEYEIKRNNRIQTVNQALIECDCPDQTNTEIETGQ